MKLSLSPVHFLYLSPFVLHATKRTASDEIDGIQSRCKNTLSCVLPDTLQRSTMLSAHTITFLLSFLSATYQVAGSSDTPAERDNPSYDDNDYSPPKLAMKAVIHPSWTVVEGGPFVPISGTVISTSKSGTQSITSVLTDINLMSVQNAKTVRRNNHPRNRQSQCTSTGAGVYKWRF
jgi:hypothetical protein